MGSSTDLCAKANLSRSFSYLSWASPDRGGLGAGPFDSIIFFGLSWDGGGWNKKENFTCDSGVQYSNGRLMELIWNQIFFEHIDRKITITDGFLKMISKTFLKNENMTYIFTASAKIRFLSLSNIWFSIWFKLKQIKFLILIILWSFLKWPLEQLF